MTTLARTHVATRRNVPPFDLILVTATVLVSVIGVVMVYTATRGSLLANGDDPKTFLKKQGLFVVLGLITMVEAGTDRQHSLLADRGVPARRLRGRQ
jgi:cell division protein FtsW (lipid II flippase)